MTERRLVRWVLFSVPVVCALQWAVVRKVGEPYPAVIMPSFAGDATAELTLLKPTLVFTRGGNEIRTASAYQLFDGQDMGVQYTLVNHGLHWRRKLDDEARDWLWAKSVAIEPSADGAILRWTREYHSSEKQPVCLGELTIR